MKLRDHVAMFHNIALTDDQLAHVHGDDEVGFSFHFRKPGGTGDHAVVCVMADGACFTFSDADGGHEIHDHLKTYLIQQGYITLKDGMVVQGRQAPRTIRWWPTGA